MLIEYYHMDVSNKSLSLSQNIVKGQLCRIMQIMLILIFLGPSGAHTNPPGSDQLAHTNWGTLQLLSQVFFILTQIQLLIFTQIQSLT